MSEASSKTWKTKHGIRRVRQEEPTLDEAIAAAIGQVWQQRDDRYSELRGQQAPGQAAPRRVEMSYIGG